jgi:hypothetical protein
MNRFLFKLTLFLPIPLLMGWVNWTVDPVKLFPGHYWDPARYKYEIIIAQDLLAGRSHYQIGPYQELIVDEVMFRNRPHVDVLALGSSVAKPIHESLFGGLSFFNGSIFGGGLEEMIAVYELARESGVRPGRVVLQIDATVLGDRSGPSASILAPLLRRARMRMHLGAEPARNNAWTAILNALVPGERATEPVAEEVPFYPYDALLSPRYLQLSTRFATRSWFSSGGAGKRGIVEQWPRANQHLMYPDGSIEWCQWSLDQTPESIRQSSDTSQLKLIAGDSLGPREVQCRMFEAFVSDLLESGIVVEIFLPPVNPWQFDRVQGEFQQAGKTLPSTATEAYVRSFAEQHRVRVRGSLDPRRAGVSEEDFIDFVHLRRAAITRLFQQAAPKS